MIGKTISHYRILEKLGEGGMGVVYKAEDLKLKRTVALKFLPQQFSTTDDEHARFRQEAQAAAALNHPNICTIHAIETHDGQEFIDMEFVDGETLRGKIPIERISDAVSYAMQIGEALSEAHGKGIVHRDVKADNIMINSKNNVKVMDFGLAKLKGSLKLTQTSTTVGTLAYMSPEQIQGGEADARSDMFSFGVLLFEMLTGQLPFRGEHEAAMLYSIVNEQPASITHLRSEVPPSIAEVIRRTLQKEPDQRYDSMSAVVNELAQSGMKKSSVSGSISRDEKSPPSLAVLPFVDMSQQKDQEYFCDGVAEDLINALAKIKTLRVPSRTSAFTVKGMKLDVMEIGRKFNVESVLEGSVQKSGNRLRVTAQLVKVSDGYHLWSERYDRELNDVFAIQDEIVENIVRSLKIVLSETEKDVLEKVYTTNVEAYDFYLRGRKFFYASGAKNFEFALQMFRQAILIDPNYALAYAGLADCYSWLYMYIESNPGNLEETEKASRKALALDPGLAEAHVSCAQALALKKQYEEAERYFQSALRLNPVLFEALYLYGRAMFAQGKLKDATRLYEEAIRVRPEDYQTRVLLGTVYKALGETSKWHATHHDAIGVIKDHLRHHPEDVRARYLGAGALVSLGEKETGLSWAREALKVDPNDTAIVYNVACIYSLAGEIDEALTYLEHAIKQGFAHKEWINQDPDLAPLRLHPRFKSVLEGMK